MQRINEKYLLDIGFVKRANMYLGYGYSVQQGKKLNSTLWTLSKGMKFTKDFRYQEELNEFIADSASNDMSTKPF